MENEINEVFNETRNEALVKSNTHKKDSVEIIADKINKVKQG